MSVRSFLSKINFESGRNPVLVKNKHHKRFIPAPYKSVVLFQADFELAWAWRYSKSSSNPLQKSILKSRLERDNIPKLLHLCEQYNVPVTWLTVGHLFIERCKKIYGVAHHEIKRLPHFENNWWKYSGNDWYENDPCSDYIAAPEWYCPDLINLIINSRVKHEVGCHTFSHIDCTDKICSSEVFISEIEACKKAAEPYGINLKSFVHPGHTIGNLNNLRLMGFTSFRTDYENVLGFPIRHGNGLWELKNTAEIAYRNTWSINYHKYRYKKIIDRAIKNNRLCLFWFHPSFDPIVVNEILPELFHYINMKRDELLISTTNDYIAWINSDNLQ